MTRQPEQPDAKKPSLFERVVRERDELRRTIEVVRRGIRGLYRSQIPRMGAALAYRTIFSIIPVLVISLLVFGALVSDNQVKSGVERLLDFTGLDQIVIDEAPALPEGDPDAPGDEPAQEKKPVADTPGSIDLQEQPAADAAGAPAQGERLDRLISDLVSRVNSSLARVPTTSIAIISIAILIYAALSMLVEVERAFNQIYNARSGRGWLKRLILYWSMLTLGAILLAATFTAGDLFKRWALSLVGEQRALAAFVGFAVTVLISTALLLVGYLSVPNTRVHFRPAVVGALLAALLWELGKWGFRSYLEYSTGYARLYGSLAVLPLFLLWVYVTWIIVLFGLQIAYALQHVSDWRGVVGDEGDGPAVVDPAMILLVAGAVAERFSQGQTASSDWIADRAAMTDQLCERMLDRLVRGGFVHRVELGEDDGYTLARPPDSIPAADVLALGDELVRGEGLGDPSTGVLGRINAARARAAQGVSLSDLLAQEQSQQ